MPDPAEVGGEHGKGGSGHHQGGNWGGVVPTGVGQRPGPTSTLCVILGVRSKGPSQMLGSRPWWPSHGGLPPSGVRSLRGLEGGLEAADLGIPNGTPDVKDELIREGKVTEPFVQSLG